MVVITLLEEFEEVRRARRVGRLQQVLDQGARDLSFDPNNCHLRSRRH